MDFQIIEQYLQKIKSVVGCKIIIDENERIEEIHILSGLNRSPKQIIRDVEAILLTKFDLSIDHKKISVAQIKEDIVEQGDDARLVLNKVEYHNEGSKGTIKVILQKDEETYENSASGINTVNSLKRLVGNTVLKVVEEYCDIEHLFNLEDVTLVTLSNLDVVVVIVSSFIRGHEQILSGTAIVKHDLNEAIARATLDAVNRVLNQVHV
ncbi:hypothetical protein [Vallitalea okinawensis]|uniref:hypothetical protein n=1 Tax=Vallitalea okinawensis TaxID=2078660 RepID=UPI000CFCFACC|nr:hypothetical protein [Vallitalea okinawensis]